MQLGAVPLAEGAHQVGIIRREKPDRSAAFLVFLEELRGHRLAVSFLDAGKTEHRGPVALECLPESGFDIAWSVHDVLQVLNTPPSIALMARMASQTRQPMRRDERADRCQVFPSGGPARLLS